MAIDKPRTNLYKIPHLSAMSAKDIKDFEENGVTPRDRPKTQEVQDGRERQPETDQVG